MGRIPKLNETAGGKTVKSVLYSKNQLDLDCWTTGTSDLTVITASICLQGTRYEILAEKTRNSSSFTPARNSSIMSTLEMYIYSV